MRIFTLISQHAVRFALGAAVLVLLLLNATGYVHLSAIQKLELFTYDTRLNMLLPKGVDERIVIIDIDEKSLQAQGRWPWGRNKLADLVNILFDDYHIQVLGFDMVFAEKDESSGLKHLEAIQSQYLSTDPELGQALGQAVETLRPTLDFDALFANSLKNRNVVLGYVFSHDVASVGSGALPQASFDSSHFKAKPIQWVTESSFSANLADFQANSQTGGYFNINPDADGMMRRVPMLVQYDHKIYQSLSLAVAGAALGVNHIEAGFAEGLGVGKRYAGLEWLKLGQQRIPVDKEVAALIPYRGPQGSFHYISATDVLTRHVAPALLKDKIVLVGTTAAGLLDLRATPVQNVYAGVEIHANMIAGILDNNIKEQPAYTVGAETVLLMAVGLLLIIGLPLLNPFKATLLTLAVTALTIMLNLLAWQQANLVLPLASVLLLIATIYFINMTYGFFVESRGKRQLAHLFGQYVPPELVDEMAEHPDAISLEGENREMTVLFSDVRGFTHISEGLDPKALGQLMNDLLTPMTQVIHQHRGTIDKYMGDAVMAFWGAPLPDQHHAKHALQAAIGMIHALEKLQMDFANKGLPPIHIGVGINTGLMVVGNMGSAFRMAYTVMGDAVNLGSRLESLTKIYNVPIIVSEFTVRQVPEFAFRPLDWVRVKGRDKPVVIYEPICEILQLDKATNSHLKLYDEALKHYRNRNWDLAEMQFIHLQQLEPSRALYALYIARIVHFRQYPPANDWDGVFNIETK